MKQMFGEFWLFSGMDQKPDFMREASKKTAKQSSVIYNQKDNLKRQQETKIPQKVNVAMDTNEDDEDSDGFDII